MLILNLIVSLFKKVIVLSLLSALPVSVFFKGTATTVIYTYGHTLSLHDALPISNTVFKNASGLPNSHQKSTARDMARFGIALVKNHKDYYSYRSEEHTSELQSIMRTSFAVLCLQKNDREDKELTTKLY